MAQPVQDQMSAEVSSDVPVGVAQAIWVSDGVLGARSAETRAAFIAQLQADSTEASVDDLQWLVKATEPLPGSGPQLFKPRALVNASSNREHMTASRSTTDSTSK